MEISLRTYQRWMRDGDSDYGQVDRRKRSRRVAPANKLSEDEREVWLNPERKAPEELRKAA